MEISKEVRESKMRVLEKLIALAMDPAAKQTAEAEMAMNRAEAMMKQYNIQMTEVMAARMASDPNNLKNQTAREDCEAFFSTSYSGHGWEKTLGFRLAPTFNCKAVWTYEYESNRNMLHKVAIMGIPEDVAMTVYFFDYLQNEIGARTERYSKAVKAKASFAFGMVVTVCERLDELYQKVANDPGCRELMVLSGQLAVQRMKEEFPNTVRGRGKIPKIDHHFENGKKEGARITLSSGRDQIR